jgi:hypothetical protein
MPQYTEEDLQRALNSIVNGIGQREAAREYGIPPGTLRHRINGTLSRNEAHIPQQRLSEVQEQHLTKWVLAQESLGLGLTHGQIRAFAGRILYARGDALPLGKRWMAGFL